MKCKAKEKIPAFSVVCVTRYGNIKLADASNKRNKTIGIAIREFCKGDIIEYIPNRNTDDIVVSGQFSGHVIETRLILDKRIFL